MTTKRPPAKRPPAPPKRRKPPGRGGRSGGMMFPLIIAAIVVIGVIAVIFAVSASNSKDDKSSNSNLPGSAKVERSPSIKVTGDDLPPLPDSGKDPAVGQTIPEVTGKNFSDNTATIKPTGKAQVIATIAHWCPHCQAEVPRIMDLRTSGKWPANVDLSALVTATDETLPNYPPSAWLKREGWNAPVVLDDAQGQQSVGQGETALGVTGFPFLVWTDAQGKVVLRTAGEIPQDQLQTMLDQLSKGETPTAPNAGASSSAG